MSLRAAQRVGLLSVAGALLTLAVSAEGRADDADVRPKDARLPFERTADVGAFPSATITPLLRMGTALGGVGALGWGFALWARRRRTVGTEADARIDVLARRSLGPRHQVALIEVSGQRILVGMGTDTIRTLADLSDPMRFAAELDREVERGEPLAVDADERRLQEMIGRFEGLDD